MAPVPPITRPIIICGMARSGTSLIGQLLKTSPDIVVFPELSPASTGAQFDLLSQIRSTIRAQPWRPFTDEDIQARVVELLRRIWSAGRDPDLHDDTGQRRFALKQPHAEDFANQYERVLGDARPQWVYALRDPIAIYDSTLRQAAWGDIEPDRFLDIFLRSTATARTLKAAGDLLIFDVSRGTQHGAYRAKRTEELFAFLGLAPTPAMRSFVSAWPEVNTSEALNRGPLSDEEIAQRLTIFAKDKRFHTLAGTIAELS